MCVSVRLYTLCMDVSVHAFCLRLVQIHSCLHRKFQLKAVSDFSQALCCVQLFLLSHLFRNFMDFVCVCAFACAISFLGASIPGHRNIAEW